MSTLTTMLQTRPVAGCLLILAIQATSPVSPASLHQVYSNCLVLPIAKAFQPVQDEPVIQAWHPAPYDQGHQPNRQSTTWTRLQRGILNVSGDELVERLELDNRNARSWIARSERSSFPGYNAELGSAAFHRRQRV